MDSPTFEFKVSSFPRDYSTWLIRFTSGDVLRRLICLAGYVALQDDTLCLPLSDRTTFLNSHTIRLGSLNSLSDNEIARITRHLYHIYHFDFPAKLSSELVQGNEISIKANAGGGGDIHVTVSRIKTKVFKRDEDVWLGKYVEMWLERNWSEPTPIPADASVIDSLGIGRYSKKEEINNEECVICLEYYGKDSKISRLPCSHVFHGECIKKWLQINLQCLLCHFQMSNWV